MRHTAHARLDRPFDPLRTLGPVLLLLLAAPLWAAGQGPGDAAPQETEPDASEALEPVTGEEPAENPDACSCPWSDDRERLVDHLLDGNFAEAVATADELLAAPSFPEDQARRVSRLRARALEELDRIEAAEATPPPPPPPLDVTFQVRSTRPGRSFRSGSVGRLRVSSHGITYVPEDSPTEEGWSISWESFASAGEADGIWDVAHPLVLATEEGDRFFVTQVTRDGRFVDGEEILRYIERGRRRYGPGSG